MRGQNDRIARIVQRNRLRGNGLHLPRSNQNATTRSHRSSEVAVSSSRKKYLDGFDIVTRGVFDAI